MSSGAHERQRPELAPGVMYMYVFHFLHNWKTFYFVQKQYFDRNNARQLEYRKVMMTHARLEKKTDNHLGIKPGIADLGGQPSHC